MNSIFISAINLKQVLVLRYHGYTRTVEPHCFGLDKEGMEKLRCWQTEGGSNSGERHGWKLLNVSEIHSASPTGLSFHAARDHYNPHDPVMSQILARI